MTAYLYINGSIDEETPEKVSDFLHIFEDKPVTICINSNGGALFAGEFITMMLNNEAERVTLVLSGAAYSQALHIFSDFKGQRRIIYGSYGMLHYSTVTVDMNNKWEPSDRQQGVVEKATQAIFKKRNDEWAKAFLTKPEFERFRRGECVYLPFTRMIQIFPDATIV